MVSLLLAAPLPLLGQESEDGLCWKANGSLSDTSTLIAVGFWDENYFSESFSDTIGKLKASGGWDSVQLLPNCPVPPPTGDGSTFGSNFAFNYGWCGILPCGGFGYYGLNDDDEDEDDEDDDEEK